MRQVICKFGLVSDSFLRVDFVIQYSALLDPSAALWRNDTLKSWYIVWMDLQSKLGLM